MGTSALRRDARGIVMSMGRDSAMGQKYVFTSVKQASQQESSQGEPHPPQHVVTGRCQGLLASSERGACGQHVVHQNHVLDAGDCVPRTDSNIPSSASNRSPLVASVKEDRCRIRRNVVDDMSRFHALASPAHNASDGLKPRRQTRRQWDGTGINTTFSGGARHRLPIHMPRV